MGKRRTSGGEPAAENLESDAGTGAGVLETYLAELNAIRSTGAGVAETSYYPALSNLFNAVGKTLRPKIRCVMNLRNLGAGMPDGGLFTADQFQRQADGAPMAGQPPARGAIEAKSTSPAVAEIAASRQVKDYLGRYGIVIVTNLREFLLVERGPNGAPAKREAFALAGDERAFWQQTASHPRVAARDKGEQFLEFIKRACLHAAPLNNPKDAAWFLASYARDALFRVERQQQLPALQTVRSALEDALGMQFTGERGEHFFRSTLVQTLFYGVFSAWVRWHKDNPDPGAKFEWRTAEWSLHIPFVRTLYEEVAKSSRLGPLGLVEVLDWAAGVLNRVNRAEFFRKFEDEYAVQYFYEPFLEAYDPELRKALGVWYTPREVVKYQVARVDAVLREELGLPDGLADPNVVVLDPCCGTATYLVEVLHSIANTLRDKGGDALVACDLKQAAMNRVFGFEIMPAPFVVSHLQLGLLLQNQGAPLSQNAGERVGVYLTNALTGWEPPSGPKQRVMSWTELQEERDAAEQVKRDKKILVILGNPPYNGFAGVAIDEERLLSTAYRTTVNAPPPEGQGLNDLYVRFYRMAEHRIAEMSGEGVVCYISNYSWLDGRSHTGMRERLLEAFDQIWIDCLNGDKYKTGKLTPEGRSDPSVFSTPQNREGIQVGTAIATLVRRRSHVSTEAISFRDFWGVSKLRDILAASTAEQQEGYQRATPNGSTGFPFVPTLADKSYYGWPKLVELMPASFPGIKTSRDEFVVDIERGRLETRIEAYFDPTVSDEEMSGICATAMRDAPGFEAGPTRRYLQSRGMSADGIRPFSYRPFDKRWIYWERETKLLDRNRSDYVANLFPDNRWLCAVQHNRKDFDPPAVASDASSLHLIERGANLFPQWLRDQTSGHLLFPPDSHTNAVPNLSDAAGQYLASIGFDQAAVSAREIFFHALAIMHSDQYRRENATPLRQDWPRIPLPADRSRLEASAALGQQIAALLDTDKGVPGVTSGKISPALKTIGLITRVGGGAINPDGEDLAVTAGWGHAGQGGITMPAKGKLAERVFDGNETKALEAEAGARNMTADGLGQLLGEQTCDVYLNDTAYWRNIPLAVWNYHVGGYQVVKKWLSYRERKLLGRPIDPDEARQVTDTARRIAAIILLQPALDENYRSVAAAAFDWAAAQRKDSTAT